MFKVSKDYMGGYQISIGDRRKYRAYTTEEVKQALEHYYRDGGAHWNNTTDKPDCPLCHASREELLTHKS